MAPGPAGPGGPSGPAGVAGANSVSGYEIFVATYEDLTLPLSGVYGAGCPNGKKVLGGGVMVRLYTSSEVLYGAAPDFSLPSDDGSAWEVRLSQPSVPGATSASVAVTAICATLAP